METIGGWIQSDRKKLERGEIEEKADFPIGSLL